MLNEIFRHLGEQLRGWRVRRGLRQPELASRLGRNRARISELERDLLGGRWGRDRLTLFAEICDALDLVPVLVPRARAAQLRAEIEGTSRTDFHAPTASAFEELFVDLDAGEDEEGDG
jgi:transcriptional regulator with XRE-family HTH domain